jgi:hypothetical protein
MAEAQAGAVSSAPPIDPNAKPAADPNADPNAPKNDAPADEMVTLSKAELDRRFAKAKKNARYLGRKEAEAELLSRGVGVRQAARQRRRTRPPRT